MVKNHLRSSDESHSDVAGVSSRIRIGRNSDIHSRRDGPATHTLTRVGAPNFCDCREIAARILSCSPRGRAGACCASICSRIKSGSITVQLMRVASSLKLTRLHCQIPACAGSPGIYDIDIEGIARRLVSAIQRHRGSGRCSIGRFRQRTRIYRSGDGCV